MSDDNSPSTELATGETAEPQSEFGRGLIVCLAKFSAHLEGEWFSRVRHAEHWRKMGPDARARIATEAKTHPYGDSARLFAHIFIHRQDADAGLSREIVSWMNGASDHFYDLDRERSPAPLIELADLCLKIGHGFRNEQYTWATVEEIERLWRESCLALDKTLGVTADWGQW
jgi:hypothetical protein